MQTDLIRLDPILGGMVRIDVFRDHFVEIVIVLGSAHDDRRAGVGILGKINVSVVYRRRARCIGENRGRVKVFALALRCNGSAQILDFDLRVGRNVDRVKRDHARLEQHRSVIFVNLRDRVCHLNGEVREETRVAVRNCLLVLGRRFVVSVDLDLQRSASRLERRAFRGTNEADLLVAGLVRLNVIFPRIIASGRNDGGRIHVPDRHRTAVERNFRSTAVLPGGVRAFQ